MEPTIFSNGAVRTAPAYVVLDIETANPPRADWEAHVIARFKPTRNYPTPASKFADAWEKAALTNIAPITCVSLFIDGDPGATCYHALGAATERQVPGGLVRGFDGERAMLVALRALLDPLMVPETQLAGHNIDDFDLPKLRRAFAASRLALPWTLDTNVVDVAPTFDMMRRYARKFSIEDRDGFVSFDTVHRELGLSRLEAARRHGIPDEIAEIDGKDLPGLAAAGDLDTLVAYSLLDAITEHEAYLLMSGRIIEVPA